MVVPDKTSGERKAYARGYRVGEYIVRKTIRTWLDVPSKQDVDDAIYFRGR